MADLYARIEIKKESHKRVAKMKFGDKITNICAGDKNPFKHCYFVRQKNNYAECTDKKGRFGDFDINVIHAGHLDKDKCGELFKPVWNSEFGELKK